MRYISSLCLFAVVSCMAFSAYAQGESDPGFTTTGVMRTGSALFIQDELENFRPSLTLSQTFAKGDQDTRLYISKAQARIPLSGSFSSGYFDISLPVYVATGTLSRTWGLGDITATYSHMFLGVEDWTIQGTAGLKLGMGTANVTDGQTRPLPMVYQPSSGTTDVIAGGSVTWKKYITAAVGFQMPFYRYNENDYFAAYKINDTVYSNDDYQIARKLYRQGDVMLRLEGHLYADRGGITAGAVGIYHLKDDLYEDRNTGLWYEIPGSQGLTVNLTGNAFYRFGRYGEYKLDFTAAFPVVSRDVIPDGSVRQWIMMPGFTYFFKSKFQGNLMF